MNISKQVVILLMLISLSPVAVAQVDGTKTPPNSATTARSSTAIPKTKPAEESVTDKIVIAVIGGFLGWILTKSVGLIARRRRFYSYLIVTINSHLRQQHDCAAWLRKVGRETVIDGKFVLRAARYTQDPLTDLKDISDDAIGLLHNAEIVKVTKLVQRMEEFEILMQGFCESLEEYKSSGQRLSRSDVDYLKSKHDRILSYTERFPQNITTLNAIPEDYAGIIGAETFVSSDSAGSEPPGNAIFVAGQRVSVTLQEPTGPQELPNCTVLKLSGHLLELKHENTSIILNTASSSFISAKRET